MHYDIARNITRSVGFDAIMKLRTSYGISVQELIFSHGRRPVSELELSGLDADKEITFVLKHEER